MNYSNNSYCKYHELDSKSTTAFKVTAVVLVSVLGIFGNVFAIVLAIKYTVRKNLHHLIINMAVSDSLFIVMVSFFVAQHVSSQTFSLFPGGLFGSFLCKTTFFLTYVSCPVSFVTLLIISIERFRVTRISVHRSRPYSLQQRVAVLVCTWMVPMALFAFILHYAKLSSLRSSVYDCRISGTPYTLFFLFINNNLIIILFAVIFTLSILTIRRLSEAQAFQANFNEEQQKIRKNRIKSAVYMVLSSLLLSSCCWLPFFIYSSLFYLDILADIPTLSPSRCMDLTSLRFIIVYFLPLVNSCFSPCIYILFLSDFREAAKKLLFGKTSNRHITIRNSFELRRLPQDHSEGRRRFRNETQFEDDLRTTRTDCV